MFRQWCLKSCLALLLFATPPAQAQTPVQVPITHNNRVYNKTGVQCVWASLETLARYHKIDSCSHLTDYYKGISDPLKTKVVLDKLGVRYYASYPWDPKRESLVNSCALGWGACVGLNGQHMITVVHFKDGWVCFVDNLDPKLDIRMWREEEFMRNWDGWAITLVPPSRK